MRPWITSVLLFLAATQSTAPAVADVILTTDEIRQVVRLGPWPPKATPDPSNRVSGDARAVALGKALFGEPLLSRNGDMACTTCHRPDQDFTDGLERAQGQVLLDRNTQALWNLRGQRWFGWSGDTDNLWAQSLTPLLNPDEMAQTPETLQAALTRTPHIQPYEEIFGPTDGQRPVDTSVNIAKALAAYMETLTTGKTSFDRFRDALEAGDGQTAATYPVSAQRGLRTFIGIGRCAFCHSGPAFTNGEFHDAGVPYFLGRGRVDPGRHDGLQALAKSPFTLDGAFTDDASKTGAWAVRNVRFQHSNFGIFRVPTLRRVSKTSPYMHNGSLPDLKAVLRHYNEMDMERLHSDGEAILRPIGLSDSDLDDLQAFLETLSDD